MKRNALLLIDDSKDLPFWLQAGWDESYREFDENLIVCVNGFLCENDSILHLLEVISEKTKEIREKYANELSWYIVTDSLFCGDVCGGGKLLYNLQENDVFVMKWERAVIYSISPLMDGRLPLDRCKTQSRTGSAIRDQKSIIEFLFCRHLTNVRNLVWQVSTLVLQCDLTSQGKLIGFGSSVASLNKNENYLEGLKSYLEDLKSYVGWPIDQVEPIALTIQFPQGRGSVGRNAASVVLFSTESAELFSSSVKEEFLRYCRFLGRSKEEAINDWKRIINCLHPVGSLESSATGNGGYLRLLWEAITTGGSIERFRNHPYYTSRWLNVYQKAGLTDLLSDVRRMLQSHCSLAGFQRLCSLVVLEVEAVNRLLASVEEGKRRQQEILECKI